MANKLTNSNKLNTPWYVFILGGIATGFLSLIFFIFLDIFLNSLRWTEIPFYSVLILVVIEELFKFKVLKFIIISKKAFEIKPTYIFEALSFGLGFTFFEFILIYLQSQIQSIQPTSVLILFFVHSITSLFLLTAIRKQKRWNLIALLYFSLAIIIHLVYNLSIT